MMKEAQGMVYKECETLDKQEVAISPFLWGPQPKSTNIYGKELAEEMNNKENDLECRGELLGEPLLRSQGKRRMDLLGKSKHSCHLYLPQGRDINIHSHCRF